MRVLAKLLTAASATALVLAGPTTLAADAATGAKPVVVKTVHDTYKIKVGSQQYTLTEQSVGKKHGTIHIGPAAESIPVDYLLTVRDGHKHVLVTAKRGLYRATAVVSRFDHGNEGAAVPSYKTKQALLKAVRAALDISHKKAEAEYKKSIREQSVYADEQATVQNVYTFLKTQPYPSAPDFGQVKVVKSSEYRGSVKVIGTSTGEWTVTVRDTDDGYGMRYSSPVGIDTVFHF